jgi:hypothetical protein
MYELIGADAQEAVLPNQAKDCHRLEPARWFENIAKMIWECE